MLTTVWEVIQENCLLHSAIQQMKERRYTGNLKGYSKKILLVGINYNKNSENKKHKCVIEDHTEN